MIEEGLVALIKQSSAVTDIIGSIVAPLLLPEGAAQGITYQIVGGRPSPGFTTSGSQRWRMQFDCRAMQYLVAKNARMALIALLNGFSGALPDGTHVTCLFLQPIDYFDSDPRQYRAGVEFYITFNFTN